MQTLETEFTYHGRTLKQINRVDNVAIYEVRSPETFIGYEVVVIQVRKAAVVFGNAVPEREVYPPSEDWGTHGWSYQPIEYEKAGDRFRSVVLEQRANAERKAKSEALTGK